VTRGALRGDDGERTQNLVRTPVGAARLSPNQRRRKNTGEKTAKSAKPAETGVNDALLGLLKLYGQSQAAGGKDNAGIENVLLKLIAMSGDKPQDDNDDGA